MDAYVNENWEETQKSPSNDCYVTLPHYFNITEELFQNRPMNFGDHFDKLELFIRSFYFDNEPLL